MAAGAGALGHGAGVRGRARGAWTGAQGATGEARGRQGTDARGRAAGAGARGRRAGGRSARQAGAGRARRTAWARGAHGLGVPGHACARRLGVLAGQLGQVGAQCTWLSSDSVFGPDSTRYFPESPNEHCSL